MTKSKNNQRIAFVELSHRDKDVKKVRLALYAEQRRC